MSKILFADDRPILVMPDETIPGYSDTSLPDHNCRNCGAPLSITGKCEYCGTERQLRSYIAITADSIMMTCG